MAFLGVDIGTSGVKATVIGVDGEILATSTAPLTMQTPQPGWAEQDPNAWWEASRKAIKESIQQAGSTKIQAIGLSGQMHSSVFLDSGGNVVRPALLWCDGRTTKECAEITNTVGESNLHDWTCNAALEGFTLPKVLWLRNNEPDNFKRVTKVMLAKDYIRYRLTGVMATEPSDASGTLMYDVRRDRWSRELLEAVNLPESLLPDVGGSSETLGKVSANVAVDLGLVPGTPIVGGGADNACGAIGVGVVSPGEATASWGTSGTVLAPTAQPVVDPKLRTHTFRHAAPNTWYVMGVVLSAGGAFAWFRDQLARDLTGAPDADKQLDEEAKKIAIGADGVTFLPYLQGDRTPHRDASARGAFIGMTLAHTRAHLTRAVVEGVCFAMRDSITILREMGLPLSTLLLTGGGSKSNFLRQLQADVYGLPVTVPAREEGPAYGAALLAAVGAGAFPDIATACKATLGSGKDIQHPDPVNINSYEEPYKRFRMLYPVLKNNF